MKDFTGKNVVITGASMGIGQEIAKAYARERANVFLVARNKERLEAARGEVESAAPGANVEWISADVTDSKSITSAIDKIGQEPGGIQVVAGNAGIVIPGYFEDLPIETFERVNRTNYLGSVYLAKASVPHLLKNHESVITFTASLVGIKGIFGYSNYAPTKFALVGLADVMRAELRPKGLQVTVLCPPDTRTPGYKHELEERPRELDIVASAGKVFSPQEVANCYLEGVRKGKRLIFCGFDSKLLYYLNRLSPALVDLYLNMLVKRGLGKTI